MDYHSGGSLKLPKFGLSLFPNISKAVDFPIPLMPTKPKTWPGRGTGRRWSLNAFLPYLWVVSLSIFFGTLMIFIAEKGHFLTQIPHPTQSTSEMEEIVDVGMTSIQSASVLLTGHPFLHYCLHLLGLHFSGLTIAILCLSSIMLNYNIYQFNYQKTKQTYYNPYSTFKIRPFDIIIWTIASCYLWFYELPSWNPHQCSSLCPHGLRTFQLRCRRYEGLLRWTTHKF